MYKVMIVDDLPKHRTKMAAIVNSMVGYHVMATLEDGADVMHWLHNNVVVPDIILLDVEMRKMDGITLLEYLSDFFPSIRVIIVSSHFEPELIADAFAANAYGFIWKHDDYKFLMQAIVAIKNNQRFIDPRLEVYNLDIQRLVSERQKEKKAIHKNYQLTDTELRILKVICAQINYVEMSNILHISQRTVETYVGRLNKKLSINYGGRVALSNFSLRRGIAKIAKL